MLESFDYLVVRQEGFEPSAVGLEGGFETRIFSGF